MFNKYKVSSFKITFSKRGDLNIELFSHKNKGSNLYIFENSSEVYAIRSSYTINENLFKEHPNNFFEQLKNTFFAFHFSKKNKELKLITDYFGLEPIYYIKNEKEILISSLVSHLIKSQVNLNDNYLREHLIYGYVHHQASLFEDCHTIKKQSIYVFNNQLNVSVKSYKTNIHKFTTNQLQSILPQINLDLQKDLKKATNIHFGITAGKDSLALLSISIDADLKPITSNFGFKNSADVLCGEHVSKELNLKYSHKENCDEKEFAYFTNLISYFSSGQTTASYVDMLKYIFSFKENESYVMGEGGECIRLFFSNKEIFQKYITPRDFVENLFYDLDYNSFLEKLKIENQNVSEFGMKYYRDQRMTGNFSKRHAILIPFVNKVTPFTNLDFIKKSYCLPIKNYKNELIHNHLADLNKTIKDNYNKKLYNNDAQVWEARTDMIRLFYSKNLKQFNYKEIGIKKAGIDFCLKSMDKNKRLIYFMLRLLPLLVFINNINTNKFESIESQIDDLSFN